MTRPREIIASYGGQPDRWPEAERAVVLSALRRDPALRTEQAAALELDALLGEWATRDIVAADAHAAAARVLAPPHWYVRLLPRWAAAGGVAAALGLAVTIGQPEPSPVVRTATPTVTDENAFAAVFTTTPDEESVI